MPAPSVTYVLHGIDIDGTFLGQINSGNVTIESQEGIGRNAGDPNVLFRWINGQAHRITFETMQLTTLLGICGQYGASVDGNVDLYFRATTDCSTREALATESHLRFRAAKAHIHWTTIRADHQQPAMASVVLNCLWNGSADPLVFAGDVAAAGTLIGDEVFTLGPASVNGTALPGLQSCTINSGVQFLRESGDGDIWDSRGYTQTVDPTVQLRGLNADGAFAYAMNGASVSALAAYFRRKALAGGNVANATASHVKFTAATGLILPQSLSGSLDSTQAQPDLRIALTGNPAMTIAAASAIT